MTVYNIKTSSV